MKHWIKSFWHAIVRPPYPHLPWVVLTYVALCAMLVRQGGVFTGHLFGFDDHVRMTQVLNWINGAGWYDRTIMRVNAPEGFTTIWSRIVDIPIAAVIVAAQTFVPQKVAALIAAAVVPLIETAILFQVAPYFVRPLVGKAKARLIVLFLLFSSLLNLKTFSISGFFIGEASHHPWYVILNLSMFGAAARIVLGSASPSPRVLLALSIALLTAVGIEGYPTIAATTGLLAMTAWLFGRPALAARGAQGVLMGAVGALLLLPMHRPPSQFFTVSFAEPSILGVLLIFCAGIFLQGTHAVLARTGHRKCVSAALLVVFAASIGAGLVWAFPDIRNGGAAALSPEERIMAATFHEEARSVLKVARGPVERICLVMPMLFALAAGGAASARTRRRRQAVHVLYFGLAGINSGLSCIYSRYYHHAMTTSCAWLLWSWENIKQRLARNADYSLRVFLSFVALGPLWMLLIPAIAANAAITSGVLLFPALMQADPGKCDSLAFADYLDARYRPDTRLFVPYMQSAAFLYQTKLRIDFLANYPSQNKFIDNYKFMSTKSSREAEDIAVRHAIDIVAVCAFPPLYSEILPEDMQPMLARLQTGHVPSWLKKVDMNIATNYVLYEVDRMAVERDRATEREFLQ